MNSPDKPKIIQVLEDAKLAHEAGDFVSALKFYQHFFDHALDHDPYAYYGARLSHCLTGWGELAAEFPAAKNQLEAKKQSMLEEYLTAKEPERFHDYLAICRTLGHKGDALDQFLELHHAAPKSAAKLTKFVWHDLLAAEYWQICSDLMPQASLKMDELFAVFDEANKLKDIDPAFNTIQFDQHIVTTMLDDLQKVVMVLRYADRGDEISALERQFHQGVSSRDHAELAKQASAKASFLFVGH